MTIKGIGEGLFGKLTWTLDGVNLVIKNGNTKTIPLANIRTCAFKPKSFLTNPNITVTTNLNETESIPLYESGIEEGKKFCELITSSLMNRSVNAPQQPSIADEMQKLKSLLDSGAINKVEFNAMKKKLLG